MYGQGSGSRSFTDTLKFPSTALGILHGSSSHADLEHSLSSRSSRLALESVGAIINIPLQD